VIESSAYKNTLSPQSILLENSKHVVIQPSAFSWIQDFSFKHVSRLELHKNAFSQSGAAVGHHGPATKVRRTKFVSLSLDFNFQLFYF
jgi:hypothetical protein